MCDTWGNWATCGRASESALNFVIYNFCIKLLSWDWHQSYLLLLMSLVVDWECNHPLKNPHAEWVWICYWTSEIDCLTDHCILSFQLRRGTQQELGWKSNSFCILLEEVTFSFNSHLSLATTLGGRVYHYSHFTDKENGLGRLLGHIVNKWSYQALNPICLTSTSALLTWTYYLWASVCFQNGRTIYAITKTLRKQYSSILFGGIGMCCFKISWEYLEGAGPFRPHPWTSSAPCLTLGSHDMGILSVFTALFISIRIPFAFEVLLCAQCFAYILSKPVDSHAESSD